MRPAKSAAQSRRRASRRALGWSTAGLAAVGLVVAGCSGTADIPPESSPGGCGQATAPVPAEAAGAAAVRTAPAASFGPPLKVVRGGTYSGSWESTDPGTPAVSIETAEPVVIEACRVRGPGHLFSSRVPQARLTIRQCAGAGVRPTQAGQAAGRFLTSFQPQSLTIEHNEFEGTTGIYVNGDGLPQAEVAIRYNKARNIDGRQSAGASGYGPGFVMAQFVQFDKLRQMSASEIAWNEVINAPSASRVEDNINLYLSSGTAARPIAVKDNYIQGAYTAQPVSEPFSGGGIIVDGNAPSVPLAAGHVVISGNQVVSTSNYGIAISSGIHVDVTHNRAVSTGVLPDGRPIAAANVGIYVWDINQNRQSGSFFGHVVTGNAVQWVNAKSQRNDYWMPDCESGKCVGNESLSCSLTAQTEGTEYALWQSKLARQGVQVGLTPAR